VSLLLVDRCCSFWGSGRSERCNVPYILRYDEMRVLRI